MSGITPVNGSIFVCILYTVNCTDLVFSALDVNLYDIKYLRENRRGQPRIDNPETQAILAVIHRRKTNTTTNKKSNTNPTKIGDEY